MRRFASAPQTRRVLVAVVVASFSWLGTVGVTSGLDTSWEVALHMAAGEHLRAGHDWIYTYGPGGFLAYPTWFGAGTGAASVLFNLAVRCAFAYTLIHLIGKRVPLLVAGAGAYVVLIAWPFEAPELIVLIVVGALAPFALRDEPLPPRALFGVAVTAGVLATIKLNTAVIVAGAVVLFAIRQRSARAVAAVVGGGAFGFVGAWLLFGQRIGDAFEYLRNGLDVIGGYAEASATELPGVGWQYPWAIGLALALAVVAWRMRGDPKRANWFVAAFFGWVGYNTARHAFVRHDAHALAFFSLVCVVAIAFAVTRRGPRAALAVLTAVVALAVSVHISPLNGWRHPLRNAHQAAADFKSAVLHSTQRANASRAIGKALFDPSAAIIAGADEKGVHVEPNDAGIAFAYSQRWDPLPSFQELLTYTPGLDQRNVDRVRRGGPAYVLLDFTPPGYDQRFAEFNAPKTRLALLCNYRRQTEAGHWVLLHRNSQSACGRAVALGRRSVRPGETIAVPAPRHGGIVVAHWTLPAPSLPHKLLALVWKPLHYPSITVNGAAYRFLPAAADGPFLLQVPSTAPFGPGATNDAIRTLALSGFGGQVAQIRFDEVPFASQVP